MNIFSGERLSLTLNDAGHRAVVSLNRYAVTEPALEGHLLDVEGFTYDLTPWLSSGRNVLTVVLIGPMPAQPFQLVARRDGRAIWTLDEKEFLPTAAGWQLWTQEITLRPTATPVLPVATPTNQFAARDRISTLTSPDFLT